MNTGALKSLSIVSAVLGIILGIIGSIPFINALSIFALFTLTGIVSLIQYSMLFSDENRLLPSQNALISSMGGFFSAFCACLVFVPVALIFNIHGFSTLFEGINIFIIIVLVFFFALICAMTNAFTGWIFSYIYNMIRK